MEYTQESLMRRLTVLKITKSHLLDAVEVLGNDDLATEEELELLTATAAVLDLMIKEGEKVRGA